MAEDRLSNYSYKKILEKIQRPMESRILNNIKMGSPLSIKNKINKLSNIKIMIKMKKKISNIALMIIAARAATSYNSIK